MKRKLTLHRDTVRNLDTLDSVQGGAFTYTCPTFRASCLVGCTLSPTACVPTVCSIGC